MYDDMIFPFGGIGSEPSEPDRMKQGGKGANLIEMSLMGLQVPPGFTISTEVCKLYEAKQLDFELLMDDAVWPMLYTLRDEIGYLPLCSVRSGAPVSMPGMMDTVLNVGLTAGNLEEWTDRIGEWTTLDSYRRLLWMYGETVCGIDGWRFSKIWKSVLSCKYGRKNVPKHDSDTSVKHLKRAIERFHELYERVGKTFPEDPDAQFRGAIEAVLNSWNCQRAKEYREAHGIPDYGTAVNIVSMVFGNMDRNSCSGVCFTRNPSTGEDEVMGEFLSKAQGEDVVAGIRTPRSIQEIEKWNADVWAELDLVMDKLERHYADVQDIEFTVQSGQLFILQTRSAKRSSRAAFKIACDLYYEGVLSRPEALQLIDKSHLRALTMDMVSSECKTEPIALGLGASGGAVKGYVATRHSWARHLHQQGKPVVYVADETTPNDFPVMQLSVGLLTRVGGMTSHAAVVARGMNLSCVVGCQNMPDLQDGHEITIDGLTGRVWGKHDVPVEQMSQDPNVEEILGWAMELDNSITLVDLGLDPVPSGKTELHLSTENLLPDQAVSVFTKVREQNPNLTKLVLDLRTTQDFLSPEENRALQYMNPASKVQWATHVSKVVTDAVQQLLPDLGPIDVIPSQFSQVDLTTPFRVRKASQTMAEVLESLPTFHPDPKLADELGGQKNLQKLLELFEKAGVELETPRLATKDSRRLARLMEKGL